MKRKLTLPDLLRPGLDLVICGKAPGHRSAQVGHYFAHPSNRFWSTLRDTGLTPRPLTPEEDRELLTFGIGLTDLAKRTRGPDAGLRDCDFDVSGFRWKIANNAPLVTALLGKVAGERVLGRQKVGWGLQRESIGRTRVFVVPDTSGLNGRWEKDSHIRHWRELANLVGSPKNRPRALRPD